jgi:LCP family protein required for cell wall assembly
MPNKQYQMAKRHRSISNTASTGIIVIFVVVVLALGAAAVSLISSLFSNDSDESQPSVLATPTSEVMVLPEGANYEKSLQDSEGPTARTWDGKSRVNMLVMGLDYRDWSETPDGPSRTDSLILLTMDPETKTAGMLSIPRDLWVNIPGYYEDKINTAYYTGEAYQLPGGGPGLAVKTVEEFLGVPIHYYAQIDFGAFVKFIDEIGGVDIHVKEEIIVDPLGPGNTITLKEGVQTLDGATALAYARARNTGHGDFDRADRQQQVILAVRDNILNYYTLSKLISRALPVYQELSAGVKTNLSLRQALLLGYYVQKISPENIRRGVIQEPDYVYETFNVIGQYVLVPIPEKIKTLTESIFGPTAAAAAPPPPDTAPPPPEAAAAAPAEVPPAPPESGAEEPPTETPAEPTPEPTITLSPDQLLQEESAQVSVKNGTQVGGLAASTAQYLRVQGIYVIEEDNAGGLFDYSEIHVSSNKPATARRLAEIFRVPQQRIFNQGSSESQVDITVVIGSDWADDNPIH